MIPLEHGAIDVDEAERVLFVYRVCGLGGVETSIVNRMKALEGSGFRGEALFSEYYGSKGESLAKSLGAHVGLGRQATRALLREAYRAIVVIDHPDFMDVVDDAEPNCPVIVESHASFTPALSRLYRRLDHPRVSRIVVPSTFNKRLIEKATVTTRDIDVIPNALDDALFRPGVEGLPAPDLSGVYGGPVVIWVGRLEDEKNPIEFVSIADKLQALHPDVRFVLVGDTYGDEEYTSYRRRLSDEMSPKLGDRFSFVRGIPYGEMPKLYNLAARTGGCLLSTSLYESVPMIFIEAMACRCPVVSTDVGGVRELIQDRVTGYLYPQGDIDFATRLVGSLIDRHPLARREAVLQNGAEHVAEQHSPARVGNLYQRLFRLLRRDKQPARDRMTLGTDGAGMPHTIPGLVSTIIPVYNRAAMLREAVQSVLDQTYQNVEIIIVDDGSTDDTPAVCDRLARENAAVHVLHLPHRGLPGLARESGRRIARGEYIQYLDSDDLLSPTKFAIMVAALTAHPECDVAYCDTRKYRLGEARQDDPGESNGTNFSRMLPACISRRLWLTPTPLYRRSLCDAVGPWSDLELWEDIEYDMRVASLSTGLCYCADVLADVRDHDVGRLSKKDFYSDPRRLREMARAMRMIYRTIEKCDVDPDEEHLGWFLEDVRVLHRRCLELQLDDAVRDCVSVVAAASGGDSLASMQEISVRARIQPQVAVLRAGPRASVFCPVVVRNESTISFRGGDFAFELSYHVVSLDRTLLQTLDTHNVVFEPPLRPGEERAIGLWITAPEEGGLYLVEIDIAWGPAVRLKSLGNLTGTVKLLVTRFIKEHQWRLQLTADNAAALVRPGGHRETLRLDVTRATTSIPWHVQLNQDGLSLVAGRHYVVRFTARAAKPRPVCVGVSMGHDPWKGLGLYQTVELQSEWSSYEMAFTAEEDDTNARVHFDAGGYETGFELADVSLTDAHTGVSVESPPLSYLARFQMDFGESPLSEWWGTDRGLAIHRYYLEKFLAEFAADIRGRCLEFQNPQYTLRFGRSSVSSLDILHIDDSNPLATLAADLTKPNSLPSDAFDCVVCTHVLHTIYEVEKAVSEIRRIMKPNGVLLVAVPHVSMYGAEYGEIWRFTPGGLSTLLSRVFGEENVEWRAYGNSLTAAGELRGLASHEFAGHELDSHDQRFAVEVCARAVKTG